MAGTVRSRITYPSTPYRATAVDERLLVALARYHYLTIQQILRRFYRPASLPGLYARMGRLVAAGYCEVRALHATCVRGGSGAYVYTLAARGRRLVETLGADLPPRFRPSDLPTDDRFLRHALACADVYLAADLLAERTAGLSIERLVPDRTLRSWRLRVTVEGKATSVAPDGFLAFIEDTGARRFRYPVLLELDRGTEKQMKWQQKLRALLALLDGPYQERFGSSHATVAIVTPDLPARATTLRAWIAADLARCGRTAESDLFLVTATNPATTDPQSFFCGAHWQTPRSETPQPLLDLEVAGE